VNPERRQRRRERREERREERLQRKRGAETDDVKPTIEGSPKIEFKPIEIEDSEFIIPVFDTQTPAEPMGADDGEDL
jgi:hypothetical protein